MIITSSWADLPSTEESEGLRIVRLPAVWFMDGRLPVPRFGKSFSALAKTIWSWNPDFAILNTKFWPLSLWAARECHKRKLGTIVIDHGTGYVAFSSRILQLVGRVYEHAASMLTKRWCNRFFGVSQASAKWLTNFGITAEGVLYNAIDPTEVIHIADSTPLPDGLRIEDGPIISFAGRFIPGKGVIELIEAVGLIREHISDAILIAVGDGPLWDEASSKAGDNVYLTGALTHDQTLAIISRSAIFCLPTASEGFSTVLLEAAALSTPIVSTNVGGVPELIPDRQHGILLEERTPLAIAEALEDALTNPDWRHAVASRTFQRTEQNFTWRATADALVARISAPPPIAD